MVSWTTLSQEKLPNSLAESAFCTIIAAGDNNLRAISLCDLSITVFPGEIRENAAPADQHASMATTVRGELGAIIAIRSPARMPIDNR